MWLSSERVVFWEDEKALILSDSHFGKTGHFRKSGVPVPQNIFLEDLQRLFNLLQFYKPEQLIVVGDLFHSHANKELDLFSRWRKDFSHVSFVLVKGNHDILPAGWYRENNIEVVECLEIHGILLMHDKECENEAMNKPHLKGIISGHVHPAVALKSGPRQAVSLPCFYFNGIHCILPAFSHFTGNYVVRPQKKDAVFAITSKEIMRLEY